MKIGGVEVSRCEEVLVLPRIGGDLVFKALAVDSMDEFNELCPKPTPSVKITKNGREDNINEGYLKELEQYAERRYAYICVKSLEPSEIEWDEVDTRKPHTWALWVKELKQAGLSDTECNRVQALVLDANSLNEAKLKAARDSFLHGQGAAQAKPFGRDTTPASSPSGQPAND